MIGKSDIQASLVKAPEQLLHILGTVYVRRKTNDGGVMYLTRFGLPFSDLLEIENWYEKTWFDEHAVRLEGTSAVYRIRTREIDGRSMDLVVKNSRVGEDVPFDTHTLLEFVNAEFNSPWEEFAMVLEMRESGFGPEHIRIRTQSPLAIYVPPEKMQLWQSGRSAYRLGRIARMHPGIDLDILKQYKLVYGWIEGLNAVEALTDAGLGGAELEMYLAPITKKAIVDLDRKGYAVADMKPSHVIIDGGNVERMRAMGDSANPLVRERRLAFVRGLVDRGEYSVVDYELLVRTPAHEEEVKNRRRHTYLDDQKNRLVRTELPPHLERMEIFGVPYVFGRVASTGGLLWVVGNNAGLFDYFLPERWRTTHHWKLSDRNDVYYTVTKDNINIVWKTSRVGEMPALDEEGEHVCMVTECGYNSPFEEFAIAFDLAAKGIPAVNVRAIYMAGSVKQEKTEDMRHFVSHAGILCPNGKPVLQPDHNYVTIRGYYNGPDEWVREQAGQLARPVDLSKAVRSGVFTEEEARNIMDRLKLRLADAGYDGSLLMPNDFIVTFDPRGEIVRDANGDPEVHITNFEYIKAVSGDSVKGL